MPKAPRKPRPPGWLTREQVAIRLDRTVSSVDKMVLAGRLPEPSEWGNRCILFNEAELDAFLAAQAADEEAATKIAIEPKHQQGAA